MVALVADGARAERRDTRMVARVAKWVAGLVLLALAGFGFVAAVADILAGDQARWAPTSMTAAIMSPERQELLRWAGSSAKYIFEHGATWVASIAALVAVARACQSARKVDPQGGAWLSLADQRRFNALAAAVLQT